MGWGGVGWGGLGESQTVERKVQLFELQAIAKCRTTLSNCVTLRTSRTVHVCLVNFRIKMLSNVYLKKVSCGIYNSYFQCNRSWFHCKGFNFS